MVTYIDEDFLVWGGEPWIDVFVLWKDFYDIDLYGVRGLPSKDRLFISQLTHPDASFNQPGSDWAFDEDKAFELLQGFKRRQMETGKPYITADKLVEIGCCEPGPGGLGALAVAGQLNTMFQRSLSSETMLTLAMEDYQKWMQNVQISFALAFVDAMNTGRRLENFTENNRPGKPTDQTSAEKGSVEFNGKTVVQDNSLFDPNTVDAKGRTNIQRMQKGLAPVGYDGKSINIHHIDQTNNSPLTEISQTNHQQSGLHPNTGQFPSQIDRNAFNQWRTEYWQWRANDFIPGG